MSLIQDIKHTFGESVFCMPKGSLHITLLDWIAPLAKYDSKSKQKLFQKISPTYLNVCDEILTNRGKILVVFDEIRVSPSTIYITGHDHGQFREIRDEFINSIELLPGTKLPPNIIHCSLARFTQQVDLKDIDQFLQDKHIGFTQEVDCFRLIHTTREPMLEFEILKEFHL